MTESGFSAKSMEEELIFSLMEIDMWENTKMVSQMEKESILGQMEANMKEYSWMV